MDHKSWPWKKRLSHKRLASSKSDLSSKESTYSMHPPEKESNLESMLESLNEKLDSVTRDNKAKDELLSTNAKMIQEAVEGREKAEKEATSLRQELDTALKQKSASNERLTQLNTALKESIQQLSCIREEHDERIRNAVLKTSREFEKGQKRLEEKLTEKSKSFANLFLEKAHLNKALVVNEKLIEELSKRRAEAETGFNTLMARLDSVEKENAFLKYEFRVLEKELDIRNEESELHRQSADVSRKKIARLENECQRLRALVRKRFPAAKMKDNTKRNSHDISEKKINVLIDRLYDLEGENKTLKETIAKKDYELNSSLVLCAQSTSDFSEIEAQLDQLSKGRKKSIDQLSTKSNLENKNINFGVPEMSLMDDFVEMEKLAIVSVDENRIASSDDWLKNVLNIILDENHVSRTSFDDLLEDIRFALSYMKSSNASEDTKKDPTAISGYITWKSPNRKGTPDEKTSLQNPDNDKHDALKNQLEESEKTIGYLEKEIESLKETKSEAENQIVDQKLINEDLECQLTVSKSKFKEVVQKLTALEVELEDKSSCYEELEGTCVELQLQLESFEKKEVPKESIVKDEKVLLTGWEMTAASAKLAECQETIFNLGKQLKALASSPDEPIVSNKKPNQRSTLRDRLLAESSSEAEEEEDSSSPKSKEIVIYKDAAVKKSPVLDMANETHTDENESCVAVVMSKKQPGGGVGFWRKLVLKNKRGSNLLKTTPPY